MNKLTILNNWEKAKQAIAVCKDIDEVKAIRDKAEVLRAYAKHANESLEVQNNVCEIKLRAERRIGEFSKELPTAQLSGLKNVSSSHNGETTKTDILRQAGISHHERYEAIANLPEDKFDEYINEVKASNEELTTAGIIRLARQLDQKPKKDIKAPEGKYDVIYADPPWDYPLAKSRKHINQHYPTMDLDELLKFGEKVKEISAENCTLFLWATSGRLNWAVPTMEAWGFEYKSSMVWDKIKYNMGYYSSIRHEFLLIGGKGKATPRVDGKIINSIDSVQSIEKSNVHSEKPDEFRKIIETLYPNTKKIQLFGRKEYEGWDNWGDEIC